MEMMSQVEEKALLTSLMSFDVYTEIPEGGGGGERRARRRRRRKARADADGEAKKRRLSDEQVRFLETSFGKERKLESARKVHLAAELGLDPKQVAVWFQNRRARWKNKQMEEEFLRLKSAHDAAVVHKCHLENEVLKLQGKLSKAEEEIRKLSDGLNGVASSGGERGGSTPSSSLSTENHQPLLGEVGVEDLMYIHEYNYNNFLMEWVNMYGI